MLAVLFCNQIKFLIDFGQSLCNLTNDCDSSVKQLVYMVKCDK